MLIPESGWFAVNEKAATKAIEDVYENYSKYEVMGKKQGHRIKTEFSFTNMVELLKRYLDKYAPVQVGLKLPQLKKIELPKLKKVE
jgi:poly(A) polymerase Pap1